MLSILDRHLKLWQVWLVNCVALAWFAGMLLATQAQLPSVKLFRCPIGFCLGYYSPNDLQVTLTRVGSDGRQFLLATLLPLDMVLPALVLGALTLTYAWYTRSGEGATLLLSNRTRYVFLCVPLCYCLADYAENWSLVEAIRSYPNIPYRVARRTSILTATKTQLIVAAVGVGAALVVAAWGQAHRHEPDEQWPPRTR